MQLQDQQYLRLLIIPYPNFNKWQHSFNILFLYILNSRTFREDSKYPDSMILIEREQRIWLEVNLLGFPSGSLKRQSFEILPILFQFSKPKDWLAAILLFLSYLFPVSLTSSYDRTVIWVYLSFVCHLSCLLSDLTYNSRVSWLLCQ